MYLRQFENTRKSDIELSIAYNGNCRFTGIRQNFGEKKIKVEDMVVEYGGVDGNADACNVMWQR